MIFLTKNLKNLIIVSFCVFFLTQKVSSLENRILYKVNNEIITSFDLKKELRYLSLINSQILNLEKKDIFEISKKSIIREKIKKIEILNHVEEIKLDKNYIDILIKNTYSKIGFKNLDDFEKKLDTMNISLDEFIEKISIEAMWNQIIYEKFKLKIKINKTRLENEISSRKINTLFQLSEIVFVVDKKENLQKKVNLIKSDIENKGFNGAALIHSISESRNQSGKLGWINESSINEKLSDVIKTLKIGEYTEPQNIPGGFLIIKLNDIKNETVSINMKKELDKLIKLKTNQQLNQFSNIYFNKIKKNIKIEKI